MPQHTCSSRLIQGCIWRRALGGIHEALPAQVPAKPIPAPQARIILASVLLRTLPSKKSPLRALPARPRPLARPLRAPRRPSWLQGLDNCTLMKPVTKFSEEIPCASAISEVSGVCWGRWEKGVGMGGWEKGLGEGGAGRRLFFYGRSTMGQNGSPNGSCLWGIRDGRKVGLGWEGRWGSGQGGLAASGWLCGSHPPFNSIPCILRTSQEQRAGE